VGFRATNTSGKSVSFSALGSDRENHRGEWILRADGLDGQYRSIKQEEKRVLTADERR